MTLTRQCPFDGCGRAIEAVRFACRAHWFSLSTKQKAEVWSCYTDWQDGEIDGDELRRRQQAVLDEAQGTQAPGETT